MKRFFTWLNAKSWNYHAKCGVVLGALVVALALFCVTIVTAIKLLLAFVAFLAWVFDTDTGSAGLLLYMVSCCMAALIFFANIICKDNIRRK